MSAEGKKVIGEVFLPYSSFTGNEIFRLSIPPYNNDSTNRYTNFNQVVTWYLGQIGIPPKFNLQATVDPSVNDDDAAGYSRKSIWFNTVTGVIWLAQDVTTGGAVWQAAGQTPDTVATTNNTHTTISTTAIPTGKIVSITSKILGKWTGGAAGVAGDAILIVNNVLYNNVAGTLTKIGESRITTIASQLDADEVPIWGMENVISSTNVLTKVIGATNNNISWQHFKTISIL